MSIKIKKTENEKKPFANYPVLVILFSFFFAIALWFFVQEAESPTYTKYFSEVPVTLQELSGSFSVIEGGSPTVGVTLKGKRSDLNRLRSADLGAYIDMSSITTPGTYQFDIKVMSPEGTEVYDVFPKNAQMQIDQTLEITVPVKVELGSYTVAENSVLEVTPLLKEIPVKGPKRVLEEISCAKIITGDLGEIKSGFESNLGYSLFSADGKEINSRHLVLPEANMRVSFSVYKTKMLPLSVSSLNGYWNLDNMTYEISPKEILVKGEPALIDSLQTLDAVVVDEKTVNTTLWKKTFAVSALAFPAGDSPAEVLDTINVTVRLKDNTSKTIPINLKTGRGSVEHDPSIQYEFINEILNLTVRGSYSFLPLANADEFVFHIDLSELAETGEYEVPVQIVQRPTNTGKFYLVGEYTVKVRIF